jgi:pyrroloquinoline quinone biosynthesis protein B
MKPILILVSIFLFGCSTENQETPNSAYMTVLGIAQDAGYPQMNCKKECCKMAWKNPKLQRMTSCMAIIDPETKQQWIIDATPNIKDQIQLLKRISGTETIDGILLTHAHIGHYTGLMHFGKEVMGANKVPVYTMPRMKSLIK